MSSNRFETPTIVLPAIRVEPITERPKPYVPRVPPNAEIIPCPRCGHPMEVIRQKDAGWLLPIAEAPGREDGEDILGYSCMRQACLDGAYDKKSSL